MIPGTALIVPLGFPLRVADDAQVRVTIEHFAKFSKSGETSEPTWTKDEVALVRGDHCLTMMHAPHVRTRACIVIRDGKMPTAPQGVVGVHALPAYDPVDGLLVFGPCR